MEVGPISLEGLWRMPRRLVQEEDYMTKLTSERCESHYIGAMQLAAFKARGTGT